MASTLQDSENPPILKKKLNDLRVVDLRAELDKRELDKSGVKVALIERLTKALEEEGHDPEEFLFEVAGDITPGKKPQSKRVNKKLTNETESVVSLEGLDDSNIDDEEKLDSDDEKLAIDEKDDTPKESNQKVAIDEKVNSSTEAKKSNVESKLSNNSAAKSAASGPATTEDTNNVDGSSVVKLNDNASLIVHVDDTQSDVDGDLDLTMCDGASVSGKATPVNVDSVGSQETSVKKLMEESVIIDDNDNNNDSNEVLELENDDLDDPPAVEKKVVKNQSATVSNNGASSIAAANVNSDAKKQEAKKSDGHHDSKEAGSKENIETGASNTDSTAASSATTTKIKSSGNAVATKDVKTVDKDRGSTDRVKRVSVSSCNLWVSGLSTSTKASDLRMLFSKYGRIIAAKVVSNPKMPGRRCYGFITMFSSEEASKCIQHLHRTELNGKMISVERTKNTLPGVMKTTKSAPASKKPAPRPHPKPSPESKKPEKPKSEPEPEPVEKKEKEPAKEEEKKEKPKTVTVDVAEPTASETKEHEKSKDSKPREKSRDKSREKSRDQSRERMRGPARSFRDPRSSSMRGPHYRDYRSRMGRGRPYGTRGRGRGMMGSRGMMHNDRGSFRKPFFSRRPMTSSFKSRGNMLTFQKIKEERLKQRQRQRERELRETERRRVQDMIRQKEIERKQREEALRLERERERLRIDREKLERERETILRLEREKQKLERERLEREREELRRREQIRLDEPRRTATKRTFETRTNLRESDPYWEDRKRPTRVTPNATNRFHEFEHRNERVSSFERHDTFDRRGGAERFETRDKGGDRSEFDTIHRPGGGGRRGEPQVQVREERKVIERDHRFERPLVKEEFRGGRERDVRGGNRGIRDAPIRRPPTTEGWKSGNHDRRITDLSRSERSERYMVSNKGTVNVSSTGAYSGSSGRSYGGDRDTWSGNERSVGKSYSSSTGLLSNPHWGSSDSRKLDSSHSQSWSSQSDRWGSGASSLDTRNTRGQPSLSGQGVLSQPTSSLYGSSVQPVISHSLSSSSYGNDRYMPGMRRYN